MLLIAVIFFKKISKSLMYSAIIISEFLFKKTELSSVSLIKLKDIKVILNYYELWLLVVYREN